MLLQTNTEQMIVCLNNLVPTVSGKMWNINDHFLIMIWYDDWSRMLITMPEWLVTEPYRLMLRHRPSRAWYNLRHSGERLRVYCKLFRSRASGCSPPPSVWKGRHNCTDLTHTEDWEPVWRLTLCEASGYQNLGHHNPSQISGRESSFVDIFSVT